MKTFLQKLLFATNSLESQLYPGLGLPVQFRLYRPDDFNACQEIYRKNEANRFPPGALKKFEEYLQKDNKTLIVAEIDSKVVGCGGMALTAPNTAVLSYGLVDPQFQGKRIGTTLTLLRIAQLEAQPFGVYAVIFAVDASMPFYRRFGFHGPNSWNAGDGTKHPVGILHIANTSLRKIKVTLQKRGIVLPGITLSRKSASWIVQPDTFGLWRLENKTEPVWGAPVSLIVVKTARIDAALAFYRAVGLVFREEQHGTGPIHYSSEMNGMVLEIYPGTEGDAPDRERGGTTMLGFKVASLDYVLAELQKGGIAIGGIAILTPPKDSQWGRRATVADPDGRAIELAEAKAQV